MLHLTPIGLNDLEAVLHVLQAAAESLKNRGIDQWSYWLEPPLSKIQWVKNGLERNEFYDILLDGKKVGLIRIQNEDELYWGEQDQPALYIHSLVISDQHSGKGLGTLAMDKVAILARNKGIKLLRLDCVSDNSALCRYYLEQGFEIVGKKQMPLSENSLFEKVILDL